MNLKSLTIVFGAGVGALTFSTITYYYLKKKIKSESPIDLKWEHIGSLKEIDLYPIKSSSAVSVQEAECNEFGLHTNGIKDRRLIILNGEDGKIASVGRYPSMLSINIKISSDGVLSFSAKNEASITLNLNDLKASERLQIVRKMKGYSLRLIECQEEHHEWISRVILGKERGMNLYLGDDPIIERSFLGRAKNDLIPIMVMHDKSVKRLNSKIDSKNAAHYLQFRGNLLIQSLAHIKPFDEDNWLWLKISDDTRTCTILRFNSPCLRCIIPNINIRTCERNADFEPLKTMRSFRVRSHPKEPDMGVYFDVHKTGNLKCGDAVYVQYK